MLSTIQCYIPNLNVLAQTDQKLWPCPLLRSKASAILSLCKFMQIRPLSQNPVWYTSLHTKFQCCISSGSKVIAICRFFHNPRWRTAAILDFPYPFPVIFQCGYNPQWRVSKMVLIGQSVWRIWMTSCSSYDMWLLSIDLHGIFKTGSGIRPYSTSGVNSDLIFGFSRVLFLLTSAT